MHYNCRLMFLYHAYVVPKLCARKNTKAIAYEDSSRQKYGKASVVHMSKPGDCSRSSGRGPGSDSQWDQPMAEYFHGRGCFTTANDNIVAINWIRFGGSETHEDCSTLKNISRACHWACSVNVFNHFRVNFDFRRTVWSSKIVVIGWTRSKNPNAYIGQNLILRPYDTWFIIDTW